MAKETIKTIVEDFCCKTTMRGVSRTLGLKGNGLKLLWGFAILAFLSISIYSCIKKINNYYGYPTVTVFHEKYTLRNRQFPAVTICNLNPINGNAFDNDTIIDAEKFYSTVWKKTDNINAEDRKYLRDRLIKIEGYFQNIDLSEATHIGHQLDTFLHTCTWNFLPKATASCNITTFLSPKHFNCFTIHAPKLLQRNEVASRLTVVLYLDHINTPKHSNFFDVHEDISAGVQVKLLQPSETPMPTQFAFTASPGTAVRIPFSLVTSKLAPPPFSNCYEVMNEEIYSMSECIRKCSQRWVTENCKCVDVDITFAMYSSETPNSNSDQLAFCGKFIGMNITEVIQRLQCTEQRDEILAHVVTCGCGPACTNVRYQATVSAAPWPQVQDHLAFYENHIINKTYQHKFEIYNEIRSLMKINKTQAMMTLRDNAPLIQENFIKIVVDLSDLPHVMYIEQPKYSWVDLAAGLGGLLNFYSGITVLFFVEIIEFSVIVMKHYYKNLATVQPDNKSQSLE